MIKTPKKKNIYLGTGKRKEAIAQVLLTKSTSPSKKDLVLTAHSDKSFSIKEYFPRFDLQRKVFSPFFVTNSQKTFDIKIKLSGGGFASQADATCLGIARALAKVSSDYVSLLKENKLLTRDDRKKERKKYGLKKARKAPQFSKR